MNTQTPRRQFLSNVGKGMLIAGMGSSLAHELGISTAFAEEEPGRLSFGDAEPLVSLLQETPIEKLQTRLVGKLKKGEVSLRQLIQAAALANARQFGGDDYIGMHTLMALKPAYVMSQLLPPDRQALIILKVLYRNSNQIQSMGGPADEHLQPLPEGHTRARGATGKMLRRAVHEEKAEQAELLFQKICRRSPEDGFNKLMQVVADGTEVHRIVFAHRSWDMLDLVGMENAQTLLRQSLRYCLRNEKWSSSHHASAREVLPKLLDQYSLISHPPTGRQRGDEVWVDELSKTIFEGTPQQAAEAAASALKENFSPDDIGEAISLAANQLVLRDIGRTEKMVAQGKPEGSTHGDSIGVHAQDSANAWRHIAKVSDQSNTMACLILGAYQVAWDRVNRGGSFLEWEPRPYKAETERIANQTPSELLKQLDGAIREKDQDRACAMMLAYCKANESTRPALDLLLNYATSEDGALHAEKYYITTTTDYADTRPKFRSRHLVGLARVTASEYGQPAPGYAEACALLGV